MSYYQQQNSFNRPGLKFGPGAISPFIKYIIIINLAVFILQQDFLMPGLTQMLGLTPYTFYKEFPNLLYQPFTYMFLHGGVGHIFFNMLALWMFGTEIEYTWGTKRFAKFYLLGGIAGAVLTLLVKTSQMVPMVGASAAIYAILSAYWFMFPNRKLYIYLVLPVPVKWAIPGLMLFGFLFGGANVAHFAHLGGALFGFLYMKTDWKFLSLTDKLKRRKYKKQEAKFEKNRQNAEKMMQQVDRVLDRINEVGIENLTKEERKILDDASSGLSNKDQLQ